MNGIVLMIPESAQVPNENCPKYPRTFCFTQETIKFSELGGVVTHVCAVCVCVHPGKGGEGGGSRAHTQGRTGSSVTTFMVLIANIAIPGVYTPTVHLQAVLQGRTREDQLRIEKGQLAVPVKE